MPPIDARFSTIAKRLLQVVRGADAREAGADDQDVQRVHALLRRQGGWHGVRHGEGAKRKAEPALYVAFLSLPRAWRLNGGRAGANAAS